MKLKDDIISKEVLLVEQENQKEMYKTATKKVQFINQIKNGLGEEIKNNPNQIKIIEKSFGEKVKLFFKRIFTKF